MKNFPLPAFVFMGLIAVSCAGQEPVVETTDLKIEFDDQLHSRIISKKQEERQILSDFKPTEYISVNGEDLTDFGIQKIQEESVQHDLGHGDRLTLTGRAGNMLKTISITTYQDFPSVAVYDISYENIGEEPVMIDRWVSHNYHLSNKTPDTYAYPFWSYQSESTGSREDWVLPVSEGFSQENYQGMNNPDYGGGTPVLSIWRPDGGLAIGHLETVPKLVSLPVSMESEDQVDMRLQYDTEEPLEPGSSLKTHQTFVRVQQGDYFSSLIDYREMMVQKGISFTEPRESAYEPQWCAWGYEREFTMDQVYGALPKVDELHYHWAVLDDGWQTNVGDWELNPEKYPQGDQGMIEFVNTVHDTGVRSKIWWAPLAMHPDSDVYENHPEWLLLDENMEPYTISWWDSYYMCPAYEPVIDYHTELVRTMIGTWGYHGIKIDGQHLNAAPPCYNPAHDHDHPEDSYESLAPFFEYLMDEATAFVDDALIEICPCGTSYAFHNLPHMTQAVASDPTSSWQIRHKGKTLKALMGRSTPYFGDHVELSRGGRDFASQVGIGAVIGTKFTWPAGTGPDSDTDLTAEREDYWEKWAKIHDQKQLAKGVYIGELYDIGFDRPETHVIEKEDRVYYGLYADQNPGRNVEDTGMYEGPVELRGLRAGVDYTIIDYESGIDYGTVSGPAASIETAFTNHLLLEAIPQ